MTPDEDRLLQLKTLALNYESENRYISTVLWAVVGACLSGKTKEMADFVVGFVREELARLDKEADDRKQETLKN